MTDLKVNVSKVIKAPISKVFDAWLDPATLAKFMLPMPGMQNPMVENESQIGGSFSIVMQVGENKIPHTGKYLEINRPEKLAFTWSSPESHDESVVTITLTELENQSTNLELVHVKFIDEERRANHQGGWTNIVDKFVEVV